MSTGFLLTLVKDLFGGGGGRSGVVVVVEEEVVVVVEESSSLSLEYRERKLENRRAKERTLGDPP
jgi:hypothetical protein